MARAADTYRGFRRNEARKLKMPWWKYQRDYPVKRARKAKKS